MSDPVLSMEDEIFSGISQLLKENNLLKKALRECTKDLISYLPCEKTEENMEILESYMIVRAEKQ